MNKELFEKWYSALPAPYKEDFMSTPALGEWAAKGFNAGYQHAVEHCKQGEPILWTCLTPEGKVAYFDGKPMYSTDENEIHNVPLFRHSGSNDIPPQPPTDNDHIAEGCELFTHAMPKSEGKATLDKMREALEAVNGMFWVDKSTKHEIYESAHYPGQNQFTKESLGKHVFQLLRELDGETFESNILSTPQPTTDISELNNLQTKVASLEFKLKGVVEVSKCKDGEIKRLEQLLATERDKKFARFNNEECWIYQGDGQDYLDSLICPVVIKPDVLKSIIAKHTVKA